MAFLNLNVGLLGHIDSGKTSLARALSTTLSTAALDKHPQSTERGITLDLGFSSFTTPLPARLAGAPFDGVQVTLVDCPGHASLIRTIMGGAQIINLMLLVVDATKGVQTQTAECLVIGELTTDTLLIVINKVDLLPAETRAAALTKLQKRLAGVLAATRFAGCPQLVVAARPGGGTGMGEGGPPAEGMAALVEALLAHVQLPAAASAAPFLCAVDHCFAVRGQGTVLTGTVLQGRCVVGQALELPGLKVTKKIKSLQAFRRPVTEARRGDRVGICFAQLDAGVMERGLLAEPGSVPAVTAVVAAVQRIRFFKGAVPSKARFHITLGHVTVMAQVVFFGGTAAGSDAVVEDVAARAAAFTFDTEYAFQEELRGAETPAPGEAAPPPPPPQWALLTFDAPVLAPPNARFIGSRLDFDSNANTCRLAMHGCLAAAVDASDPKALARLKVIRHKQREGAVERWADAHTAIGRGMFKKDSDISRFENLRVTTAAGDVGVLQGAFGKSGAPDRGPAGCARLMPACREVQGAFSTRRGRGCKERCRQRGPEAAAVL